MRSRLLVSAAILAAEIAMASAQNAPDGSGQDHARNQARSQRHGKASGDRSIWDRAIGQERLRPERRQPASQFAKERGQQGVARSKTQPHLSHKAMGQAGERDARARNQAGSAMVHPDKQRGGAPDADAGQDQVRKVQAALSQQGFSVGDPDGKLGKRTKEALIAFQKQRGFRTTGRIDRTTLHALLAGEAAPDSGQPSPIRAPVQTAPQGVAPATTGQGGAPPPPAASPQLTDGETPPPHDGLQMPESGATSRVPAGSPQEDYKDDPSPGGGDQR
jgi:peptidoglycan hydrolase-like protein with peptidoglycan-binding domain